MGWDPAPLPMYGASPPAPEAKPPRARPPARALLLAGLCAAGLALFALSTSHGGPAGPLAFAEHTAAGGMGPSSPHVLDEYKFQLKAKLHDYQSAAPGADKQRLKQEYMGLRTTFGLSEEVHPDPARSRLARARATPTRPTILGSWNECIMY
jgi:hypothetical protein